MVNSKSNQSSTPATPLKLGEILQVKVQGLGSFGEGLSRVEETGDEIFIPKAAPFDELSVKIIEKKKGRYRAEILEVIKPAPDREEPKCQHFQECGGCDFQHLSYEVEMAWKERITKHWIRRSSLAPVLPQIEFDLLPSPDIYNYRHRVRMQVRAGKLHFFKPQSNDVFELKECPVLEKGFFRALSEKALEVKDARDWTQSYFDGKLVDENEGATYELAGQKLHFEGNAFTQANWKTNELLWKRIEEDVLQISEPRSALDLFSGIGNFSLPLKTHFEKVVAVESDPISMKSARKNSKEIEWKQGPVDDVLIELLKKDQTYDFILLDPPRAGAPKAAKLIHEKIFSKRITYVSCNLETLIQDLVAITKRGKYQIERWTVADMFPRTHHIESVVSLKLKS